MNSTLSYYAFTSKPDESIILVTKSAHAEYSYIYIFELLVYIIINKMCFVY